LDPDQRVKPVAFAPLKPATQLKEYSSWVCPVYLAKNETAASWAVVIDIGWNGRSRDVLDMEHLTRRLTPRPSHARRQHGEALQHADANPH
jgi:hypothetical protein